MMLDALPPAASERCRMKKMCQPGKILLGCYQGENNTLLIEMQTMADILSAHMQTRLWVLLLYRGFSLCCRTCEDKKADTEVKIEAREDPSITVTV